MVGGGFPRKAVASKCFCPKTSFLVSELNEYCIVSYSAPPVMIRLGGIRKTEVGWIDPLPCRGGLPVQEEYN